MFLIKIMFIFILMITAEMEKLIHIYLSEYLILIRELYEAFP